MGLLTRSRIPTGFHLFAAAKKKISTHFFCEQFAGLKTLYIGRIVVDSTDWRVLNIPFFCDYSVEFSETRAFLLRLYLDSTDRNPHTQKLAHWIDQLMTDDHHR